VAVVRTPLGVYLPGGGVRAGESPREAAEREAREECGLIVRASAEIGVADQYVFSEREQTAFVKHSRFFRAHQLGSVERGESDHSLLWLAVNAAREALTHGSHRWAVEQEAASAPGDFPP
jgi:8-oxo-dGTP diphosphatase